ncbi:MAG TPA: hypothetical protein VFF81_13205 [Noviherbaspirillum sp.]|nr:hypothetical protein [Noviherbaspirillum sp.]
MKLQAPVKRIGFACDFLRARLEENRFVNFQWRNLAWLENVLGAKSNWQRWEVETSTVSVASNVEDFKHALRNDLLFSQYASNADQTWASLYDTDDINAFPAVLDELCQHDLVIGFELPPTLKRAIHRAGKKYLSIYIHPVRFLRDLCFLITTNSNDIADAIAECAVAQHEIDFQVRRFSALFSRLRLPALSLPDGVPVLIGQTEKDSVLVREGRFSTWADHEDELSTALSRHSELIFLEHPYCQNSSSVAEYLRSRHGKTVISVQANSYGVVFSPIKAPFFLTLASSLGVEAQCAGRDCTFLLKDPREKFLVEGIDIPNTPMVSHAVLREEFWQRVIFGEQTDPKDRDTSSPDAFFLGDHYIRNSLESWAFGALQSGLNIGPVKKTVVPAATLTQDRVRVLTNILCGTTSDEFPTHLDHARKQTEWGCVDMLDKPIGMGAASTIDLTHPTASHYLVEGFHTTENWGVWSNGRYARIVLPVDLGSASEAELCIAIGLKVYDGILPNAPVVQILMDGREVGYVLFRVSSRKEHEVRFTGRITKSACQLEFYISHTGCPALISQAADTRELGFGLYGLNVSLSNFQEAPAGGGSATCSEKFWGIAGGGVVELTSDHASLNLQS